jgi:hypothetical protein
MKEPLSIWEQQPGESDEDYAFFCLYRDLGGRTARAGPVVPMPGAFIGCSAGDAQPSWPGHARSEHPLHW